MTGQKTLAAGPLIGRPFQKGDWGLIADLHRDPKVARWLLAPGWEATEGRARKVAEAFCECWLSEGFGPYLWSLRGRPAGYAGLRRAALDGLMEIEVLWGFRPEHWGRGYATLAARAAIEADGPRQGEDQSLASWTLPANRASRRVMEKLGFAYERDTERAGLAHVVYRWRPDGREISA